MEIDQLRLQDEAYCTEIITALLHAYQDRIFRYCVTRLGKGVGEEIAQEVFVSAWEMLPRFRQESSIETWLFAIAKRKCAQAFRNRARREQIAHTFVDNIRRSTHPDAPRSPEDSLASSAPSVHLDQALNQLREDDRILLNLRYAKGLSTTDIADLIGKSDAVVRKRILRGLQHLKRIIVDSI